MRLLNVKTRKSEEFFDGNIPPYAILSHRWGDNEVTFRDIKSGRLSGLWKSQSWPLKLEGCRLQAGKDNLSYIWVDTCCIDKTNSVELNEAINSMFNWYKNATKCYVYLSDVHSSNVPEAPQSEFRASSWFTRGWTLQELLAPKELHFYGSKWESIGTKNELSPTIEEITGIPRVYLTGQVGLHEASVAQRMSWAANRVTTRTEDVAYCLLGLFRVTMPMIYGEKEQSFVRLQHEIMKNSEYHSILAWDSTSDEDTTDENPLAVHGGALATSPADFANSGGVLKGDSQTAYDALYAKVTEKDVGQRFAKIPNNVITTNIKQLPTPPSPMEQARFFQDAAIEQSKCRLAELTTILMRTPQVLAQERGWPSQHQIFEHSSQVPLIVQNFLGNGSLGVVEEVYHKDYTLTFVRKKVLLPYPSYKQRLKIIEQEAKALHSLTHPHITKILGSYQDGSKNGNRCYSLLIWPVGQSDLKTFLEAIGAKTKLKPGQLFQSQELMWLRTWFKCLISALAYIHSKGIRHQDIKPSNIIHRQGQVFFTDFSSSSQFCIGQTTSTENPARISQMYAAPEVCRLPGESPQYNRHGLSTEIFSLGCVFAEILTVADGRRLQDYDGFHEYCAGTTRWDHPRGLNTENFQPILLYGRATDRIHEWFANSVEATTILMYGKCIQPMLAVDRANRPSAVQIEELLQRHQPWLNLACPCQNALTSARQDQLEQRKSHQPTVESDDSDDQLGALPGIKQSNPRFAAPTPRRAPSAGSLFPDSPTMSIPVLKTTFGPTAPLSPAKTHDEDESEDLEIPWRLCLRTQYWEYIDGKVDRTNSKYPSSKALNDRNTSTEILASWVCREAIEEMGYKYETLRKMSNDGRRTKPETFFSISRPLTFVSPHSSLSQLPYSNTDAPSPKLNALLNALLRSTANTSILQY